MVLKTLEKDFEPAIILIYDNGEAFYPQILLVQIVLLAFVQSQWYHASHQQQTNYLEQNHLKKYYCLQFQLIGSDKHDDDMSAHSWC
jgi:hypothetical protein